MIEKLRMVGEIMVVTATAEFHPLHQLTKLALELENNQFKGNVMFDLLAVNGLAENRFVSIKFNGHQFDKASFAVEKRVQPNIQQEQDVLVRKNLAFLNESVLSAEEVERFQY